jgi:hypothetical protein
MRRSAMIVFIGLLMLSITVSGQNKPPATFADFDQWETLAPGGSNGGLSPDGRWLAYGINRSNRNNELRVIKLADRTTKIAAFGGQPVFSSDSKWFAYTIGLSEADQEKLRNEKKPVQNNLGLLDLSTGETMTLEKMESFSFSRDGFFLAMRRYGAAGPTGSSGPGAPSGPGGRGGTESSTDEPPGSTLIVRQLSNGREISFGNVSQYAWQDFDHSHLLAMIISAEGKTGNGVHLYDPQTGVLRVLDSSATVYTDLAWRKDAADLAVLRAKTDDRKDGPTQALLAWTGLGKAER